jgi:hypothetical protein
MKRVLRGYEFVKSIGKGAHGDAVLVLRLADKREFVIKRISVQGMSVQERELALNEVRE